MIASGSLEDDGLHTPEVGSWSDVKYRLISNYAEMFSTSMRKKWDKRVYIDLFAGAGRAAIKDTGEIVETSSLLAMGVTHPFDRMSLVIRSRNVSTPSERELTTTTRVTMSPT